MGCCQNHTYVIRCDEANGAYQLRYDRIREDQLGPFIAVLLKNGLRGVIVSLKTDE